ncbi:DUF411 domain-containing protein [Salinimonas marina]|uniref:DUF411 domain-containing protein n=1 Tax=Salinimonas marina TaxID=2785918 RepID=A0A7S9DXX8_9ALTE|nr:DUF411 domain-containing protein [Salinimonas marina]QPG05305.1 DUF411 domain-containing protein [Salinimonas marina]
MNFYLNLRTVVVALCFSLFCAVTGAESSTQGKESSTQGKASSTPAVELQVFKSAQCGCCKKWMAHLTLRDFIIHGQDTTQLSTVKQQHGIAAEHQSCHTAVSQQGFVFEGHVPARFIRQFLQDPVPDAIGLSVPGMPTGSPGMEMGQRFEPYAVLVLFKDGSSDIYARVTNASEQY